MVALKELLTTDIGLFSLFVILFIVFMGIWLSRYFRARMLEDEAAARAAAAKSGAKPG
jgi:ABC-type transporter Mla subunit MlaD